MRWNEIINEAVSQTLLARSFILDLISPLKAHGVESITIDQILDQMNQNPDFYGFNLEADFIMASLRGVKGIKIERDAESGDMTVFIDNGTSNRQVGSDQAKKDDENIRKAALRTIDRDKE